MDLSLDIHPDLWVLYEKSLLEFSEVDNFTPEKCLSVSEVMRAHFLIADFFYNQGEGIGGIGPRDQSLLVSAVSRQWVGFGGELKWKTTHERAATLLFGLVHNHAFHDANKRTAFISTAHYLLKNGFMLTKNSRELENFTVQIAERTLVKYRRFKEYCKKGDEDPEVRYISWYLKHNSRRTDNTHHTITYRDLDTILKTYDFFLDEPSGNRINVSKKILKRKLLGGGHREKIERVCRIGFPGWSRQVSKQDVKNIRRQLRLTSEYGIDSAAFYKNADNMRGLIASYEGALKRLAFR